MRNGLNQFIAFLLLILSMLAPLICQESDTKEQFGARGFYVGITIPYFSFRGDLDGELILFNAKQIFYVPKLENAYGFAVNFGLKSSVGLWEFTYMWSKHRAEFQGIEETSRYHAVGVDAKPYILRTTQIQPFLLLGINVPWISVNDAWISGGEEGDATYIGVGINAGAGVIVHLQPEFFISLGAVYRYLALLYASGEEGRSRDITDLYVWEDGSRRNSYLALRGWSFTLSFGINL